ncbi:hypothetical protein K2173_011053 [Erythroxylum novogranatense]|uniref:Uncharacterized protein n=1 Tax=Erythroxylum novogranatense TaxID=1862640 RepID=A0AAV8T0D4_9ROSI|nr:hypothetical protein K2173_011053 [Erythroxylum novogranatense]
MKVFNLSARNQAKIALLVAVIILVLTLAAAKPGIGSGVFVAGWQRQERWGIIAKSNGGKARFLLQLHGVITAVAAGIPPAPDNMTGTVNKLDPLPLRGTSEIESTPQRYKRCKKTYEKEIVHP